MTRPNCKTTLEKTYESCRQGNHATIYGVQRDPKLANKNIIKDKKNQEFPFISGAVYRGEWAEDQKSGFGAQTNPDGSKYEGEFRMNLYHGSGSMWTKKGKKYVKQYTGNWENGKMSGFGAYFHDNGDIYKGEWLGNKRSGEGRLDNPNGDYFIGQWLDGVKRGYGTMYHNNGNVFEGIYRDDISDGPGRYFYAATRKVSTSATIKYSSVRASTKDNVAHQATALFLNHSKVYEGEWVDGAPNCGEYREPTRDEEIRFREPTIAKECFELPKLGLLDSQSILDIAKSESRITNAVRRGLDIASTSGSDPTATFSKESVAKAAVAFAALDTRGNGLLPLGVLLPVFRELGFLFSDEDLDAIRVELEIDIDTALSFPEAIDIAAYQLSNAGRIKRYVG